MRVYMMTDMEGAAGVLNFEEWIFTDSLYYRAGRELLTREVNAAVDGLFAGGATHVLVADSHGPGGIDITLLDPRVEVHRGYPDDPSQPPLYASCDVAVWVAQHAKACTPYGHLCHTQSFAYVDETVNGVSIGEFGELAMCASELGVRCIFASGDEALTKEAQALVPGIETVAVKWGLKSGTGEDLSEEEYPRYVSAARHRHPVQARELIRAGAQRAVERARREEFGIVPLTPPFTRVVKRRRSASRPYPTVMEVAHPTSVIGAMRERGEEKPVP